MSKSRPLIRRSRIDVSGPEYKHDCDNCTYLGFEKKDGKMVDLYFCPQHKVPTIIARYSSDGPDYISGVALAGHFPELMAAKTRAEAAGLLI